MVTGAVYFGGGTTAQCTLWHTIPGGNNFGKTSFGNAGGAPFTLAVADSFTTTAASTVYVDCVGGGGASFGPVIAVTQVATLHP